jgi:hypothetical protein
MTSLLDTATAVESNVLDCITMAEDVVLHTARTVAEAFEPLTKGQPELPRVDMLPTAAEVVDHTFGFVDRLVANLRDFTMKLVGVFPIKVEARPTAMKAPSKAQAA